MRIVGLQLLVLVFAAGCTESYYPCRDHNACYPHELICDLDDGRCIEDDGRARTCELDVHCKSHERCRSGVCTTAPSCTTDEDCPAEHFCHMLSGDCVPEETGCSSDEDCPPGTFCEPGEKVCRPSGCRSDEDCPAGQVCNPVAGTCGAEGPECTSDADCIAGQRCDTVAGVCRTGGCLLDADCNLGEYCDHTTGVCRPIQTGCQADADCPSGSWCDTDTGDCRTGCRADADCPSGTTCNLQTGGCEGPTGCTRDEDCPMGHRCDAGDCVPVQGEVPDGSLCVSNSDCQSRNCVPVTDPSVCLSPCRSSAGCPSNWSCVEVTSAWYCIHEDLLSQILGLNIDVGAGEYGAYCSGQPVYNPFCHCMICNQNLSACTTDCMTDADCPYGTICRANYETGILRSYCFQNPGFLPVGSACDGDYYCNFNVCLAGDWQCSAGCCSSLDCPAGWTCGRIQSADPQAPGFAKGCFPATWPGNQQAGTACTQDSQCRSNLCMGNLCSDLCCTDIDCPHPMRCTLFVDTSSLAVTLCQ